MEKKRNSLMIVTIILLIASIGLLGFTISNKFLSNNDVKENLSDNCDSDQNNLTTNSYEIFKNNIIKSRETAKSFYASSSCDNISYVVSIDKSGDLFISYFGDLEKKYNNYKLSSNVLSFNIVPTGQGGCSSLYFLNLDGSVSSVETEYAFLNASSSTNELKIVNNIGNYKNIVSIVEGESGGMSGARIPLFIDINGNVYSE